MNKIKSKLSKIIIETIKTLYNIELIEVKIEKPPNKDLWDYAFGTFLLSKETKQNPAFIATEITKKLENNLFIKEITPTWPYVNIKLSNKFYTKFFLNEKNDDLNIWKWKTIVVDYVGANVWKPLHIGHICAPSQWQASVNIAEKLWYKVIGDTHIWDWGIIFWKLILAYKKWGEEVELKRDAVEYLLSLYIKISAEIEKEKEKWLNSIEEQTREEFKLLAEWNEQSIELWTLFTKESIHAMDIILKRLYVHPQYNIWESFYEWLNLPKMEDYPDLKHSMKNIVKELIDKKIATKNTDWSVWVIFPEEYKIPSCILQKNNWTHWYLASDLACIKYRMENWNPSKIIYHFDVRQKLHIEQVFNIATRAGWVWECDLFFAYNWFISLKEGAMSTRKWNIIRLSDLLDESSKKAKRIILEKRNDLSWLELDKLSEIIWVWAIKYWYLSKSRTSDVIFDWDEFMTFEWNSGPYISYAYVRCSRIIEKSGLSIQDIEKYNTNAEFELQEEIDLIKELSDYHNILLETFNRLLPHILVNYTYNLTKKFSSFYNSIKILDIEDMDTKMLKLKLLVKFRKIIQDSFDILAIELPKKM